MAGRKTKLTPEVKDMIVKVIRAGNYNQDAAAYAGIDESTFYRWLSRGESASRGIYCEFYKAVKRAESEAKVRNVALIQDAAKDTWQAAAWWLERRFPKDFGRQIKEIHGPDGGPIVIKGYVKVSPDDWDD